MRCMGRLVVTLGFGLLLAACNDQSTALTPDPGLVQVSAYTVRSTRVPVISELNGRVVAAVTAEIRPQTGGIVRKRLFAEGGAVKAGEVLYEIDPTSAQTAVTEAQATLASANVALASARAKAARYRKLVAIEAVSRESAEEAESAYKQAASAVTVAEASLRSAKIALGYARVTSPIDGVIGRSSVSQGALVTANQTTPLATVQQLDPIYVDAKQSALDVLRIRRSFESGAVKLESAQPVVKLLLDDGSTYVHAGQLQLSEAIVDETTSTVTLRARFPNPDGVLLPGLYGRIKVEGAVLQEALLVPQVAVSRDSKGNALAYVIKDDNTIEQRTLVARHARGDQWIVEDGLKDGDRVVVEGLQKIRAGTLVEVTATVPAASDSSSAVVAASE